jgi:hypothetical protein
MLNKEMVIDTPEKGDRVELKRYNIFLVYQGDLSSCFGRWLNHGAGRQIEQWEHWLCNESDQPFIINLFVSKQSGKAKWQVTGKTGVTVWMSAEAEDFNEAIAHIRCEFVERINMYRWMLEKMKNNV